MKAKEPLTTLSLKDKETNDTFLNQLNEDVEALLNILYTHKVHGYSLTMSYYDREEKKDFSMFGISGDLIKTLEAHQTGVLDLKKRIAFENTPNDKGTLQ